MFEINLYRTANMHDIDNINRFLITLQYPVASLSTPPHKQRISISKKKSFWLYGQRLWVPGFIGERELHQMRISNFQCLPFLLLGILLSLESIEKTRYVLQFYLFCLGEILFFFLIYFPSNEQQTVVQSLENKYPSFFCRWENIWITIP